jgi:hypothetical protein
MPVCQVGGTKTVQIATRMLGSTVQPKSPRKTAAYRKLEQVRGPFFRLGEIQIGSRCAAFSSGKRAVSFVRLTAQIVVRTATHQQANWWPFDARTPKEDYSSFPVFLRN